MPGSLSASEVAALQAERDLYQRLLALGANDDLESFLREALGLIQKTSGARGGYLELRHDAEQEATGSAVIAEGFTERELADVRTAISRGVVAEALATGRTIVSASALDDPRFSSRASVKANRIEAVLCAPLGDPPFGVLYLQDRLHGGPFSEQDRARVELFARYLSPLAERLVLRRRATSLDPTRPYRATLALGSVVGRSEALARALREVAAVAARKVTVLLTGPSGTGKTQLARVLHDNSPRAARPFIAVNCAALPENLVESELFGAMPGAHSTATRRMPGKVEAAEGGTLFLDEVADLPLLAQSKLLQLLQSFEYFPLGATQPLRADVRIVAATNTDLRTAVERRSFREDLLYRLQIVPIRVPSLAERREDIRELVQVFAAGACESHGLPPLGVSPNALRAAETADWPGNVRQLENAVEAGALRAASEGAAQIELQHLLPDEAPPPEQGGLSFQAATRRFQRELLSRTLEDTGWNVVETARRLDVTRSHIYNLIRAHGLEGGRRKGTPDE